MLLAIDCDWRSLYYDHYYVRNYNITINYIHYYI